ncbi:MAG: hypothetical protein IPG07_03445 [Crocinitomicaceae bacterium]|nr:hypothetical protein [Crocinitomicaceae bacterium]
MKLSEIKKHLETINDVTFQLPDGSIVPIHFHVTEVGQITKHFIDCGGTVRNEKKVNFQLWEANDFDHRLAPQKLLNIISLSENKLGIEDSEIEVEYQSNTIGKYDLGFDGKNFLLLNKQTDCLAKDNCGIPVEKLKLKMSDLSAKAESCCTPGGGCC